MAICALWLYALYFALAVHGASYAGYAARVGRFLPRLGRLDAG